jgi:ORF6N domain
MTQVDLLHVERSIRLIRGDKVILDEDLAELYGVETGKLVQAVKRNLERFPADFMFQLTNQEFKDLRSQFVTSSWGGRRTPPYAFSEQGVAMHSACCTAREPCRSISKSCAPLCGCGACSLRSPIWPSGWSSLSRSMTINFVQCSMLFGR